MKKFSILFILAGIWSLHAFSQNMICEKILLELSAKENTKCDLFPQISRNGLVSMQVCQKADSSVYLMLKYEDFLTTSPITREDLHRAEKIAETCLEKKNPPLQLYPEKKRHSTIWWFSQGVARNTARMEYEDYEVTGYAQALEFNYLYKGHLFSVRHAYHSTEATNEFFSGDDYPQSDFHEFDVMYGRGFRRTYGNVSMSTGMSINVGERLKGHILDSTIRIGKKYFFERYTTVAIPVVLRYDLIVANPVGVGFSLFGNLNKKEYSYGIMFHIFGGQVY